MAEVGQGTATPGDGHAGPPTALSALRDADRRRGSTGEAPEPDPVADHEGAERCHREEDPEGN